MTSVSQKGSLEIVGVGIQAGQQTTIEAIESIKSADIVLSLLSSDIISEFWLRELNKKVEDLRSYYEDGKPRAYAYMAMAERTMEYVRKGLAVTVVSYGHPGVFCFPAHEAIRMAKSEGYQARMQPAVSAEDCLFADLGIDPGSGGCQSFECTNFLLHKKRFDPTSSLILWQIGIIADITYPQSTYKKEGYNKKGLSVLRDYLQEYYPKNHPVIVYQASSYPIAEPLIQKVPLEKLTDTSVNFISTLYIPPLGRGTIDQDMLHKLGMDDFSEMKEEVKTYIINKFQSQK